MNEFTVAQLNIQNFARQFISKCKSEKKLYNRTTFDKIIVKIKVVSFYGPRYSKQNTQNKSQSSLLCTQKLAMIISNFKIRPTTPWSIKPYHFYFYDNITN